MDTKSEIAGRLEKCFAQSGFTEPSVDTLQRLSGVSLRTLYKYYPSREDMIIGALDHRHQTYLAFLAADQPNTNGQDAIVHLFKRVGDWMTQRASRGCLFVSALASHPNSPRIEETLAQHKSETRSFIAERLGFETSDDNLVAQLMILHEGLTALAVTIGGDEATQITLSLVKTLLPKEEI